MQDNIFNSICGHDQEHEEAKQHFNRHMREAIRLLMQCREGRTFLRWLGSGQSAQSILQLIMDYEEEKCLKT